MLVYNKQHLYIATEQQQQQTTQAAKFRLSSKTANSKIVVVVLGGVELHTALLVSSGAPCLQMFI